jgi:hypothetical protein
MLFMWSLTQGCSNPGLKLANAFGVQLGLKLANAFGVQLRTLPESKVVLHCD